LLHHYKRMRAIDVVSEKVTEIPNFL
jgi:hypothetical protein